MNALSSGSQNYQLLTLDYSNSFFLCNTSIDINMIRGLPSTFSSHCNKEMSTGLRSFAQWCHIKQENYGNTPCLNPQSCRACKESLHPLLPPYLFFLQTFLLSVHLLFFFLSESGRKTENNDIYLTSELVHFIKQQKEKHETVHFCLNKAQN